MLPARKHCKIPSFGKIRFPKPGKTQGFGMLPARKHCKIHGFGRRRFPKPGKTQGFGRLPARKHCKIQGFGRRRFPKPGKTQGFGMVPIRKPCKTQCLGLLQEPTRDPWDPPGSPQKSGGQKKKKKHRKISEIAEIRNPKFSVFFWGGGASALFWVVLGSLCCHAGLLNRPCLQQLTAQAHRAYRACMHNM